MQLQLLRAVQQGPPAGAVVAEEDLVALNAPDAVGTVGFAVPEAGLESGTERVSRR